MFPSKYNVKVLPVPDTFSGVISKAGFTSSLRLEFNSKNKGIEFFHHNYFFPNIKKLSNIYVIHGCI